MLTKKNKYLLCLFFIISLVFVSWTYLSAPSNENNISKEDIDVKVNAGNKKESLKNKPELKSESVAVQLEEQDNQSDDTYQALDLVDSTSQRDLVFKFYDTPTDYSANVNGIDPDLVKSGKPFSGDFSNLDNLLIGDLVTIEIEGLTVSGSISKKKGSSNVGGASYSKIKFENPGEYMTAYFYEGSTKGKIYTSEGSYIYEHNGDTGFLISIYEFKKINDALVID